MKYRDFVLKVIRIRRRLILNQHSKLNTVQCFNLMRAMKIWLEAYPHATEEQLARFFLRHSIDILYIIPGQGCTAHDKLITQFNKLYEEASNTTRVEARA